MLIIKAIYSCNIPKIEDILAYPLDALKDKHLKEEEELLIQEVNNDIFDFLKFCHRQNEMELYYVLLNEVEIKKFINHEMEIAASSNVVQVQELKARLRHWSGEDWKIVISKQNSINSLKQALLDKAKNSEDFAVIKNNFPNANISDIILKS